MIDTTLITGLKNLDRKTVVGFWDSVLGQRKRGEVVVVDYGSSSENLEWERDLFQGENVKFIEVTRDTDTWREGRVYNVGIRHASSAYVVVVTADTILSDNFITECDAALKEKQKAMILCLRTNVADGVEVGYAPRCFFGNCIGASLEWFTKVRGYDEVYHGWGRVDEDLVYRALVDGLEWVWMENRVKILHSIHAPRTDDYQGNDGYYHEQESRLSAGTIVRNLNGWGEL